MNIRSLMKEMYGDAETLTGDQVRELMLEYEARLKGGVRGAAAAFKVSPTYWYRTSRDRQMIGRLIAEPLGLRRIEVYEVLPDKKSTK